MITICDGVMRCTNCESTFDLNGYTFTTDEFQERLIVFKRNHKMCTGMLKSLTGEELYRVYLDHTGGSDESIRAVVMADRKREVERMRERWGTQAVDIGMVAEHLGVEVEP